MTLSANNKMLLRSLKKKKKMSAPAFPSTKMSIPPSASDFLRCSPHAGHRRQYFAPYARAATVPVALTFPQQYFPPFAESALNLLIAPGFIEAQYFFNSAWTCSSYAVPSKKRYRGESGNGSQSRMIHSNAVLEHASIFLIVNEYSAELVVRNCIRESLFRATRATPGTPSGFLDLSDR
jgi:hypothetical protein